MYILIYYIPSLFNNPFILTKFHKDDCINSPTAWNIDDKSDYLNVNSDGLKVDYAGDFILVFI